MQECDDIDLLRRYSSEKCEEAFAAIVARYLNLVYTAALRQVGNPDVAKDVTQSVFVLLSRKARSLKDRTILSGWLYRATGFVASEAMRSERRRRIRETAAMQTPEDKATSPWDEIEPVLDRAMAELSEKDRNLVLLRYFQNKSLKEVGNSFGISEDAAQKRVARAIENLRRILAPQGVIVSTGVLATGLSTLSSQAAPATLSVAVISAAAAGTAVSGTVLSLTQATLNIMAWTKIKTAAVALAVVATASAPLVTQHQAIQVLRQENTALKGEIQALEARPTAETAKADNTEIERLRREAAEVHKLRAQLAALLQERPVASPSGRMAAPTSQGAPVSQVAGDPAQTNPMARQTLGDQLAAEGKFPEALEHYLWCYDEGAKHSPSFVGVRGSFLLNKIKDLAKRYPPAQEALTSRRDAVEARITASSSPDMMAINDLLQLNKSLDEPNRNLTLFDQLPPNHAARAQIVDLAADQFISSGRYQDIVGAGNPEAVFDRAVMTAEASKQGGKESEMLSSFMRRRAIESGGRGVEALAGAGQVDRAIALADKVLKVDPSPEARGQLLKYAERAGNPAVVAHLRN